MSGVGCITPQGNHNPIIQNAYQVIAGNWARISGNKKILSLGWVDLEVVQEGPDWTHVPVSLLAHPGLLLFHTILVYFGHLEIESDVKFVFTQWDLRVPMPCQQVHCLYP